MIWKNTKFDWNRARAFLAAAEEGSFSAAARVLGLAQPTLGRQVAAMEEELGVRLFERIGNNLVLTPVGLDLVEQVRAMRAAAIQCSLISAGQAQSLDGLVRIAASEVLSAYVLPAVIHDIRRRHPGVEIEVVVSNTSSDLRQREADIAVRHVQPQGNDLIARQIRGTSQAHLYASKGYLKEIGNPDTPAALAEAGHVIGFDETDTFRQALGTLGLAFSPQSFPVRTENHLVQWELAKKGVGLCMMLAAIGDAEPSVVRALPKLKAGLSFTTWLVSHRDLRTSRRIRVVFDLLAEKLGERLAGNR